VWVNAEYLLWWFKDSPLPLTFLTTTSNPGSMPIAVLGDPNTGVLLGNQDLNTGAHQGARFTAGLWIDNHHQIGVEGSYFLMANQTTVRTVASGGQPGTPFLAVPFFNEDIGAENTFLVAIPGSFAGTGTLSLTSRFQGGEIEGTVRALEDKNLHLEVLAGFRFLELTENLSFATTSTGLSDPNTGLILNTVDRFGMTNLFYGWQVGARGTYRLGYFEFSATAKLAVGDMHQTAHLDGFTTTNFFNAPAGGPFTGVPAQTLPGSGIFVQSSNMGRYSRDHIAVAPEIGGKVCCQITRHLWVFAGYDFLYLNNVLRPGNQIDRGINVSETLQTAIAGNVPTPGSRPAFTFVGSDFWAQGINMGVEFRY